MLEINSRFFFHCLSPNTTEYTVLISNDILFELVTVRKRSCGKVMFLHLSVILFMGEVSVQGGLCPWGGGLCLGESLSRWLSVQGVSVQGDLCLGGSLSKGGLCQGDHPRTVKSGRYTSYWNAFLFFFYSQCMAD